MASTSDSGLLSGGRIGQSCSLLLQGHHPSCQHGVAPVFLSVSDRAGGVMACPHQLPSLQLLRKGVQCIKRRASLFPFGQLCHHKAKGINHGRNGLSLNLYHDQEGALGTHGKLPQLCHGCRACTPPLSHPLSAEPHTMSLSWHQSHLLPNIFSMCISKSFMEISLPSLRVRAHLPGYLRRLAKI